MPLHPQTQALVDATAAMPLMDMVKASLALRQSCGQEPPSPFAIETEPVADIQNRKISGGAGEISVRIYTPTGSGPFPITVYYHGGGFVFGTLDMYDATCTRIANRTSSIVVSVDYRLAPETRFPGGVDDALAALRWVHDHAPSFNGDPQRIAVAGDSAGGNLAAVTAQLARTGGPRLCHQLLIYPVTDLRCETPSFKENGPKNYLLSGDVMRWFIDQYLTSPDQVDDPRASPLLAPDLTDLPGATVITAEYDPLRDEGEEYAQRLKQAGIAVNLRRWNGQIHGFAAMFGIIDDAQQALEFACDGLRKAFQD